MLLLEDQQQQQHNPSLLVRFVGQNCRYFNGQMLPKEEAANGRPVARSHDPRPANQRGPWGEDDNHLVGLDAVVVVIVLVLVNGTAQEKLSICIRRRRPLDVLLSFHFSSSTVVVCLPFLSAGDLAEFLSFVSFGANNNAD